MISAIRDGMNVKRFHTTQRAQEETVGHHTANVMAIINRLEPFCSRELLVAAMYHDVDEAYTGDVPAPFKWDNPDVKQGLREGGDAYMDHHNIPVPQLSDEEWVLLKLADMVDLVMSSIEELGRGNMFAQELVINGGNYLEKMPNWDKYGEQVNEMVLEVKAKWQRTIDK